MKDKANDTIENAMTVFRKNGLRSVSMDKIASCCGLSKKRLYENFKNKEILVKSIVEKLILKTSKYIRLCPDISPNAIIQTENFSGFMHSVLGSLTPGFIRDLKKYYPDVYTQLILFRDNSIIPFIERCLQRGMTEGLFRPDIDKRNVAWLYCWQLQNALEGETPSTDVNKIILNINDLFLHSILNSKGFKLLNMNKHNETKEKR